MPDNLYEATGIKSGSQVTVTIKTKFDAMGTMKLSTRHKVFEVGEVLEGEAEVYLKRRGCVQMRIPYGVFPLPLDKIVIVAKLPEKDSA